MKTIMILSLAGLVACGGKSEEEQAAEAVGEMMEGLANALGDAAGGDAPAVPDMGDAMEEAGEAMEELAEELEAAAEDMANELGKALEGLNLEGL